MSYIRTQILGYTLQTTKYSLPTSHLSISLGLMLVVRGGTRRFYLALLFSYVFFLVLFFFNNFVTLILKIN
jgi:hypothetical protein